jgi:hypothetical protein
MHFSVLKVVQPIVIVFFLPVFIHTLQNISLFNFSLSNSKDDNNNPVDTNTNTAIDKSTDHGDDINWGIDPESETQNESQMSESNNKTQWAILYMHFSVLKVVQPIVIVFYLEAFIHTLQNILFSFNF